MADILYSLYTELLKTISLIRVTFSFSIVTQVYFRIISVRNIVLTFYTFVDTKSTVVVLYAVFTARVSYRVLHHQRQVSEATHLRVTHKRGRWRH